MARIQDAMFLLGRGGVWMIGSLNSAMGCFGGFTVSECLLAG